MADLGQVTAVILNWHRAADTITCLDSLKSQTYPHLTSLVVDNGSQDDSIAQIQKAHPDITILPTGRNLGFAKGMNHGIRYALAHGAEYLFILNNDTLCAPDLIAQLLPHASPKKAGAVAPLIYYASEPTRVWSIGGKINPWLLEAHEEGRGQLDVGQWTEPILQDFVPACALLISRDILATVGLFDEQFFMYYEDLDFCWRMYQAGHHFVVVPQAHLWHKVSLSSGGSDSPNERYWMARSSVIYFRKHVAWWQWPLVVAWRLGSAGRTTWRLGKSKQGIALRAYWRGLWHGLREGRA